MGNPGQETLGHGDVLSVHVLVAQGERKWRVPGDKLDQLEGPHPSPPAWRLT